MKKFLLIFFLLFTVGLLSVSAQSRTLKGKVVSSEDKKPIAGATVIITGTANGGITDNNGMFEIPNVKGEIKLDVSFIGFETKIVPVAPTMTNITVELASSSIAMGDVVVTGYGNYSKKSFTGSATNIDMGEVADMPAVSIENKLAGNVAGVTVTQNQGGPGSVANIKIRGRGSINAGNSPLYVIDGVPMLSGDGGSIDVGGGGASIVSTINPNDIASMTVIKDAAAASLYGSRAANGVIVITTKQGQAGKAKINLKADWGFSDMSIDYRPQLSGPERASLFYTGKYNQTIDAGKTEAVADKAATAFVDKYAAKPWSGWTNWKDLLFRKGFYQNYEASISGGNDKTKFFSSVSYTDQEGIAKQQAYERYTGRVNVTSTQGRFTFNASALFSVTDQSLASTDVFIFGYGTPITCYAWYCSPSQYPYNDPATVESTDTPPYYSQWFPAGGNVNPLEQQELNEFHTGFNRTMISGSAAFNIMKGFDVKEVFSYDINNERSYVWYDPRSSSGKADNGSMQYYSSQRVKLSSQTHLTYKRTFADVHSIDVLAGYEVEDNPFSTQYSLGKDYASPDLREIKNAGKTEGSWSSVNNNRMVSWVAKADYNYDSRYYVGASFRRDGSSRLAKDARWGNFWSVSGSWVLSNEKFAQSDVVTLAKIRASYGVNGTQPWEYYEYMGLYSYGYKYAGLGGMDMSQVLNDDLSWEKNYATNIGIDVSLWSRLNVTLDVYNRDTKDLLMEKDVSNTSGFQSVLKNVGEMNNKGIEFAIDGDIFSADHDVQWNVGINLAHNKNELKKLDGEQTEILNWGDANKIGLPYYSYYLKEFARINPEDGE
ncbi:MAG: SusC/RagA family TonB-linked outer membrane protein, partial [Rikenellaceae bacterium]